MHFTKQFVFHAALLFEKRKQKMYFMYSNSRKRKMKTNIVHTAYVNYAYELIMAIATHTFYLLYN